MRPITKKQRQWLWFGGLWTGGLVVTALLAYGLKWALRFF